MNSFTRGCAISDQENMLVEKTFRVFVSSNGKRTCRPSTLNQDTCVDNGKVAAQLSLPTVIVALLVVKVGALETGGVDGI